MNISFAILLENKMDIMKLADISEKHFRINRSRVSPKYITLVDMDNDYIIKISPNKLKFIIGENNYPNIEEQYNLITKFIYNNFSHQKIGIKYYNDLRVPFTNNIDGVNIVHLN